MTSHPPAFLNTPIIRRLPATVFQPAEIDVRVRIAPDGLTLECNGNSFKTTWQDLMQSHRALRIATPTQLETYQFIREYIRDHKYSPTVHEVQQRFQLRSMASAWKRINVLVKCGLLRKSPGILPRNLELIV